MSFDTALALTLLLVVVVLACTMANLLARITRLERFARQVAGLATSPDTATTPGPSPAPPELATAVKGRDPARVLFLSPRCPACDEAVEQVQQWPEEARRATVLLFRDEAPDDLVAPAGVRVVPRAKAVFDAVAVTGTPTFVHVEGGIVVGRTTGFMVQAEPSTPHAHHPTPTQETARA
jgi:thiol-disulfide isomerase/thioredoxin